MLGKYKPYILRGDFQKTRYFEGWFQKVYSKKHQASFIIIYGYATRNTHDNFGFIQVLVPDEKAEIIYFHKDEISFETEQHIVRMGDNRMTTDKILIKTDNLAIDLDMTNNRPIRTLKNSMGYFYLIPNLPCYHSVLNTSHLVSGKIKYKEDHYSLDGGMGYLEKNWGTSFPEKYFWLHAVDPGNDRVSLLFAQAEIKWLGKKFIKHVGHFRFEGEQIDLRELRNIAVSAFTMSGDLQVIRIKSHSIQLEISIALGKKVLFKGPADGNLYRDILHHTDARMDVCLTRNEKIHRFQLIGNFENIGI